MDLAQTLIRSCVRCFYETKHILAIDALIIHNALRDDDMAYLMGTNTKDLHKVAGKLKEDRFLAVHTRQEVKEGQQRPLSRTYYYIDYRATIDAIKWRVYLINKQVQGVTIPRDEIKAFKCRRCKAEWTLMEVLDRPAPGFLGFLCKTCGYLLEDMDNSAQGGHEQSTKLNAQFRFITEILPKLDQVVIPEQTAEQALDSARKVIRDESNPSNDTAPMDSAFSRPTAVKGLTNTGPTSIAVTLTTSNGPTEADLAAEQAMKEKIAKQNAMPVHFSHSTVTGEQIRFGSQPNPTMSAITEDKKDISLNSLSPNGDSTEIDNYFANLKAQQVREALAKEQEEEEEETDNDDADNGFEDVIATASGSDIGTPTETMIVKNGDGVKDEANSTSQSGMTTGLTSPATRPDTPAVEAHSNGERAAKRVRTEEPVIIAAPSVKHDVKDEAESEEDMEFEDV